MSRMSGRKRSAAAADVRSPVSEPTPAKKASRFRDINEEHLLSMCEPDKVIRDDAIRAKERSNWMQLGDSVKEKTINAVTRYCILKWTSGAGYIEEAEIRKLDLHGVNEAGVKVVLRDVMTQLRAVFGFDLLPVWKVDSDDAPTREDNIYNNTAEDATDAVLPGKYMLRIAPSFCESETIAEVAGCATDGLTVEQRGLLFVVLAFILMEADKSIREDLLFKQLAETDPTQFGRFIDEESYDDPLADWPTLIKSTFTKLKYLERKGVKSGPGVSDAVAKPAADAPGKPSASFCYSFGPRARHLIGSPMILDFVCSLTGTKPSHAQEVAALGKEATPHLKKILEKHD